MTTIKDRMKLFESSPPPIKPKPISGVLLNQNKKQFVSEPAKSISKEDLRNESVLEDEKDKSIIDNVNNISTEPDPLRQEFDSSQDPTSELVSDVTDSNHNDISSKLEITDNCLTDETSNQCQNESNYDRDDVDNSIDSESLEDFDYELCGCTYTLPGLENFVFHDIEDATDNSPITGDESVETEEYQIEEITEPEKTDEPIVEEIQNDLKRSASKRLIEEIFNTSIWRNSRNYSDDFIFCPAAESSVGPDLNTVTNTQPDSAALSDSVGDERRKSTLSMSSVKSARRSIFGSIFKSMRGGKKSADKSSSEKSRGTARTSDVSDMDGVGTGVKGSPKKGVHQVDGDANSVDQAPKKPLNMIFNRDWLNSLGEGIKKKANVMSELRKVFSGKGNVLKKKPNKSGPGPTIEKVPQLNILIKDGYNEDEDDIYDDGEDFAPESEERTHQKEEISECKTVEFSDNGSIYDDGGEAETNNVVDGNGNDDNDDIYDDGGEEHNYMHLQDFGMNSKGRVELRSPNNESCEPEKRSSTRQAFSTCDTIYDSGGENESEVPHYDCVFKTDKRRSHLECKKKDKEKSNAKGLPKKQKSLGKQNIKNRDIGLEGLDSSKANSETTKPCLKLQQFFKGFSKSKVQEEITSKKEVKTSILMNQVKKKGNLEKNSHMDEEYDNDENINECQVDAENVGVNDLCNEQANGKGNVINVVVQEGLVKTDLIHENDDDDNEVYADDSEDETNTTQPEFSNQISNKNEQFSKNTIINQNQNETDDIYDDDNTIEEKEVNSKDTVLKEKPKKGEHNISNTNIQKNKLPKKDKANARVEGKIDVYDEDEIVPTNDLPAQDLIKISNTNCIKKIKTTVPEETEEKNKNSKHKLLWNDKVKDKVQDVTDDIYDEDETIQHDENVSKELVKSNLIIPESKNIENCEKLDDKIATENIDNSIINTTSNDKEKKKRNDKVKDKKKEKEKNKDKNKEENKDNIKTKRKDEGKEKCKDKKKDKRQNKEKEKNKTVVVDEMNIDDIYDLDDDIGRVDKITELQNIKINETSYKSDKGKENHIDKGKGKRKEEGKEKCKVKEKSKSKIKEKDKNKVINEKIADDIYDVDDEIKREDEITDLQILKVSETISENKNSEKEKYHQQEGKNKNSILKKTSKSKDKTKEKSVIEKTLDNEDNNEEAEKQSKLKNKVHSKKEEKMILKSNKNKTKCLKDKLEIKGDMFGDETYDVDGCSPVEVASPKRLEEESNTNKDFKNNERKNNAEIMSKPEKNQKGKLKKFSKTPDDVYDDDDCIENESNEKKDVLNKQLKNSKLEVKKDIQKGSVVEKNDKMKIKENRGKDNSSGKKNKKQYIEEQGRATKETKVKNINDVESRLKKNVVEEYDEDDNIEEYISDIEHITEESTGNRSLSQKDKSNNNANQRFQMIAELIKKQNSIIRNLSNPSDRDIHDQKETKTVPNVEIEKTMESDIFQTDDPVIIKMRKKNFDSAKKMLKLKDSVVPIAVAKALKSVYSQLKNHIQINIGEFLEVLDYKDDLVLVKNSLGKCGWTGEANIEIVKYLE